MLFNLRVNCSVAVTLSISENGNCYLCGINFDHVMRYYHYNEMLSS